MLDPLLCSILPEAVGSFTGLVVDVDDALVVDVVAVSCDADFEAVRDVGALSKLSPSFDARTGLSYKPSLSIRSTSGYLSLPYVSLRCTCPETLSSSSLIHVSTSFPASLSSWMMIWRAPRFQLE